MVNIMTLSIVVLTPREEFIQFLDPELCSIKETCTVNGLRTIEFEYKFQDMREDKKLFQLGNKIWIQGDNNLTDCLYLINTSVEQSIYKKNCFTFDAEEVLVELTYAPLFSHLEFTTENGFKRASENGSQCVKVDYNSLFYWFGNYFNIGVVQDCLSTHAQYISITGTISPMALLRRIEEETGNVFITRYEKDILNNTIHRYLDFLNPINCSKDWSLNLEYKFVDTSEVIAIYDRDGNPTKDDDYFTITPYSNPMPSESLEETVKDDTHDGEELYDDSADTEYSEVFHSEEQIVEDPELKKNYSKLSNINPQNCKFRIADEAHNVLNSDGNKYHEGDVALEWDSSDVGLTDNTQTVVITLLKQGNLLGVDVNNKSFVVAPPDTTDFDVNYVEAIQSGQLTPQYISKDGSSVSVAIPDDSYFEIYDHVRDTVLFRTCINREIGSVHDEILDIGYNLNNVTHDIDETDTYTAVSPVLSLDENNDTNGLTRTQLGDLITRYNELEITKGDIVPMIVQRINVKKPTLEAAKAYLGNYVEGSGANQAVDTPTTKATENWWIRPYKPQDQTGSNANENTWEFLRGTAYWRAPYTKNKNTLYVETDKTLIDFSEIHYKGDSRKEEGMIATPKMGTTTSSDEDIFMIYNQCALYLKDHETPEIELDIDVVNFRNGNYNQYQIWDKVFIKIPDTGELITARVVEISKEAHDIAKNTIKVNNYTTNTIKTITKNTVIHTSNISYNYPSSKKVTVQLENTDYVEGDIRYPANKLLNFTLYKVENGTATFRKNYTKKTDAYGRATLNTKLDPAEYKMEVTFGGDEEFGETTSTLKISVGGTKETKTSNKSGSKSKTTKKTDKKVTKTTYYDKYGRSPDKKKILAIGRPSASGDKGNYVFYGMEFENYCPKCHKKGTLFWDIFYAGNEHSDYGRVRLTGNNEGSSAEGAIFCSNQRCDGDWSCQGREHGYTNTGLRATKSRFKSSKADAYKLKKGKYIYNKAETKNNSKNNQNSKNRKVVAKLSSKVKNQALSIVGNKTGYSALREICDWMDKKIWYKGYGDFCRSPETVLSSKHGNCCDQTRLFLQLADAAGLTEYYKMYYVHVHEKQGHVYALLKSKKSGNKIYIDPASDIHGCYGYVCQGYSHGSPASRYPTKPF